jgi:Ca-activated chloride channel family protein
MALPALGDVVLQQPVALWLLAALPLPFVARAIWRRRHYLVLPTAAVLPPDAFRPSPFRRMPALLVVAAIGCIAIALADPVIPHSSAELQSIGIDIVLVMDLSSSMNIEMGGDPATLYTQHRAKLPTRLERTKAAIRAFIDRRHGDRLGLVVFSNYAYVVSPLTMERSYILRYLDIVDGQILKSESMTAIGDGIDMASFLLARQSIPKRGKVVVVFTDGERNYGRDPLESLADADRSGIRVHLIGVDLDKQIKGRPAVQQLIAEVQRYGGRYYEADTVTRLRTAYSELDRLERTPLTTRVRVTNESVYQWFVFPAVVLLGMALLLNAVPWFTTGL